MYDFKQLIKFFYNWNMNCYKEYEDNNGDCIVFYNGYDWNFYCKCDGCECIREWDKVY